MVAECSVLFGAHTADYHVWHSRIRVCTCSGNDAVTNPDCIGSIVGPAHMLYVFHAKPRVLAMCLSACGVQNVPPAEGGWGESLLSRASLV